MTLLTTKLFNKSLTQPQWRDKLKEWDSYKSKTRRRKRTYLLCGLLYDENGNEFKGHAGTSHTDKIHFYYKCPKTGKTGNAEKLEKAKKLVQDERNLASKISSAENEPQIMTWLKEQLQNFEKERLQIGESLAVLEKEKDVLVRKLPNVKDMRATLAFALENYEKAAPSVQRNCLRNVFQKIVLTKDNEIRLFWRFSGFDGPSDSGGKEFALDKNWGDRRQLNKFNTLALPISQYSQIK